MLGAPVLLGPEHVCDLFSSGEPALDDWLKRRARANQQSGATRTYVVADTARLIAGYYAIATGALALAEAPGHLKRNMPDPIPMAIIARLAVDRSWQGKGLGVALLQDAVLRIRQAAAILGMRGILVHAISEDARKFYLHHGFVSAPASPMTLVMSLKER